MTLASDGGPPFDSAMYLKFLKNWGINRRLSSAYFPRSNGRAKLGVKSGKRLLMANLDATGSLDKDSVSCALLTYRNTPLQDCSISPAELLYGRPLRDHLPMLPPQQMSVLPKWKEVRNAREAVLSTRMIERAEASSQTRNPLQALSPGQHVLIQNGNGRAPTRWDRSGMVVEALPFRQYRIKYDGSGRLQVRNRQHLKAFIPPSTHNSYPAAPSIIIPDNNTPAPALASTPIRPNQEANRNTLPPSWNASPTPPHITVPQPQNHGTPMAAPNTPATATPPAIPSATPSATPAAERPQHTTSTPVPNQNNPDLSQTVPYAMTDQLDLRRSTRPRNPPSRLSPKFKGKSHVRKR